MIYIGIILILILAILLTVVPHVSNWLKAKRDTVEIHAKVHEDNGKYTFLIDRSLRIKDTNFYELNPELNDGQPAVLGNVLRCQTGCDSGLCGTGISCKNCPVRMILTNSFKLQRDFEDVEASLRLYDKNHEVNEVSVKLDGKLVHLGNSPYFILNVSQW